MSPLDSQKLTIALKKRGLPTRAVRRKINLETLREMSEKELVQTIMREKVKIMLLRRKIRQLKSDMNKKLRYIERKKNRLEDERIKIEFAKQTKKNLAEYRALAERAKKLAERTKQINVSAKHDIDELKKRIEKMEKMIKLIEEMQVKKMVKKLVIGR